MISRLLSTLLILFVVFAGTRAMIRALPGDPVDTLIAETGTPIPRELLRQQMGLDRPFVSALLEDSKSFLHGDFGKSLFSREPIEPLIQRRFANTLYLTFVALGLALFFSVSLGVRAASMPDSRSDRLCTWFGALTAALPTPWIGPVLIVAFAVWLPVFSLGDSVALPAITLSLGLAGVWARLVRNRVRDSLSLGPAQAARARGIPEWRVLLKYGLAPVSGALLAYLGTQFGSLLAGAFVTEVIFDWRGMGTLWVNAVLRRDYPVVEAATFIAAATSLLGILAGDWLRARIDRREEKLG